MSIAVPALLIFLLVLPGVILRYTYIRGTFRNSPFRLSSFGDEIALGTLWAFLLHLLWAIVLTQFGVHIDFESAVMLLLGNFGKDESGFIRAIRSVAGHPLEVSAYILGLYAASGGLGLLGHQLVRSWRWDRRFPALRFSNEWHYLMRGEVLQFQERGYYTEEQIAFVYLSAVIQQGDKTYLFRGVVEDFFFDKSGELDRIVLKDAQRRDLAHDRSWGEVRQLPHEDERYYTIEGDFFVVKYSEVKTINFEYYLQRESSAVAEPHMFDSVS